MTCVVIEHIFVRRVNLNKQVANDLCFALHYYWVKPKMRVYCTIFFNKIHILTLECSCHINSMLWSWRIALFPFFDPRFKRSAIVNQNIRIPYFNEVARGWLVVVWLHASWN